jgi:hypothetical protein
MPVTYSIDLNKKLIRTKCIGAVTLSEVIDHFGQLSHDPACPEYLDVLLDLSQETSLPDTHQLQSVAHEIMRVRERVRFGLCAVVADKDALYGMLRVFEVMAQDHFRAIHVFRSYEEAESWLNMTKSLLNKVG